MRPLPTLRQLRYLLAVAELRHFGRAADDCHVTQSTLSAGIQELETLLGVTLISRTRRAVELTPIGAEVARRAQTIVRLAEELTDAAHAGTRPLSGLLRLGVIPTIGPYLLPRVSPLLRTRFPELRLYLREDQTANLIALLNKGRLDASIIALPYDVGSLETWVLGEDRLFMACPVGHALAGRDQVTAEELLDEKWLLLEDGHCLRDHALTTCHLRPGQALEDLQATSLGTLVQMVANGLGITLLPEIAVDSEAGADSGIAVVRISDGNAVRRLAICWRRGSPRAHEFVLLGEVFREHLSQRTCLT